MSLFLLLILQTFIVRTSFGQFGDDYWLTFDNSYGMEHLTIDTISNPNNIWQVGVPQKTHFTSAFSPLKAIVTDTVNPYPINDTSIFIIKNVVSGPGFIEPHTVFLHGEYFVNSDTLTDYGKIEFSPDNGNTWIDLINDTTYAASIGWWPPKPILTGNSNGWQNINVNIAELGPIFNIQPGDTFLYRFTFISDSIQKDKDGIMFDDFRFSDNSEGIQEMRNDNLISIYPNPVSDRLTIQRTKSNDNSTIQIINYSGQILYNENFKGETINILQLNNGIYFLKYSDTKNFSVKKFTIIH